MITLIYLNDILLMPNQYHCEQSDVLHHLQKGATITGAIFDSRSSQALGDFSWLVILVFTVLVMLIRF